MKQQQEIYSWEFSSEKTRGHMWYIIALSCLIGLVIWGFLTKQYGMSFVLILLTGLVYFVENNSDDIIRVSIAELGIKIGDVFYNYAKIPSYSVIYEKENAVVLRVYLKKKWLAYIDVDIDNTIAKNIKDILPQFIEESADGELTLIEKVIRKLKL